MSTLEILANRQCRAVYNHIADEGFEESHQFRSIDQANAQADEENAQGDREVAARRATLRQYASETPLWVGSYRTTRPGDHTC